MRDSLFDEAKAGKYLIFSLGCQDYGLEILKVREIIGWVEPVFVPQMPSYAKGVINLRGTVIPVFDLKLKLGLQETLPTGETCIIIVSLGGIFAGVIIDKVKEVVEIGCENIEPLFAFRSDHATEFISGIGKIGTAIKILLNIEKILDMDIPVAKTMAGF